MDSATDHQAAARLCGRASDAACRDASALLCSQKFESALSMGVRAVHAAKNPQSGAQVRYQRLLESRYEARLLLSARQDDEEDRTGESATLPSGHRRR